MVESRIDQHGQLVLHFPTGVPSGDSDIVLSVEQTADLAILLNVRLNREAIVLEAAERLSKLTFLRRLLFVLFAVRPKRDAR